MSKRNPKKVRAWRTTIDDWKGSGQTINAFCRDRKLTRSNFDRWRRILAAKTNVPSCGYSASSPSSAFVPLRVVAEPVVEVVPFGGRGAVTIGCRSRPSRWLPPGTPLACCRRPHPGRRRVRGRAQGHRLALRRGAVGPEGRSAIGRFVRLSEPKRRQTQDPGLDGRRLRAVPQAARTRHLRLPHSE